MRHEKRIISKSQEIFMVSTEHLTHFQESVDNLNCGPCSGGAWSRQVQSSLGNLILEEDNFQVCSNNVMESHKSHALTWPLSWPYGCHPPLFPGLSDG